MNVVAFVDHEIGHRLLNLMLGESLRARLTVQAVVTTEENGQQWWPGVAGVVAKHDLPLLRYPAERGRLAGLGEVDYFLLLSWKHLMPPGELALPRRGTINLHYSLLPKYRGVYPVNWAIMNGEKETGVTYHQVSGRIDNGPIVCQGRLDIAPEDTARSLQLKLDDLACELFPGMIDQLGEAEPFRAEPGPLGAAKYYSRQDFLRTNEINLDATFQAGELINLLRGKNFPPHRANAYFVDPVSGRKIYLSLELLPEPDALR